MLNSQNLTQGQHNLYYQLKNAIQVRKSISNILEATSVNNLLAVFTTTYIQQYGNLKHTLTLLGFAMHRNNSNSECVDSILTYSQRNGILRDILIAENTLQYIEENSTYTLTPLGLAIHQDRDKYINPILTKAQEGSILQEILDAENTLDTDTLSTSELYKTINRDKADIKSRLGDVSIFPRLQENSRT